MLFFICSFTLRKRKSLFKYIENFTTKKWKFSDKNSDIFSYFCSKHRLLILNRTEVIKYGIYANIFAEKNVSSFYICKSYSHLFSKNNHKLDIVLTRKVNILTINELIRLTLLWTTRPRFFNTSNLFVSELNYQVLVCILFKLECKEHFSIKIIWICRNFFFLFVTPALDMLSTERRRFDVHVLFDDVCYDVRNAHWCVNNIIKRKFTLFQWIP